MEVRENYSIIFTTYGFFFINSCFQIYWQIQMNKLKVGGRAFPYYPRKKHTFLSLRLHRLLYSNIM